MPEPIVEILVTGPGDATLDEIAREAVEARLIACANVWVAPVTSVYRWAGEIEWAAERRAAFHTRAALVDAVVAFVEARHPYDLPNVTAVELVGGSAAYLAWVAEETA